MIRSMTGFGEARRETSAGVLDVQIRTVNHRHFQTHFRLPESFERWESEVTQALRERLTRGHVRYRLDFQPAPGALPGVALAHERVREYLAAFDDLRRHHGVGGDPDVHLLARFGDIFRTPTEWEGPGLEDVLAVTRAALDAVASVREREGEALKKDLLAAADVIGAAVERVEARAPERLERERDRLRGVVRELSESTEVDEDRLAREIAYLAERWDINEEIVRLRAHLASFRETLRGGGGEPIGKRLGFWVQEMHREANTIGSKANDVEIVGDAVEMKTAIEQMREQVENVE